MPALVQPLPGLLRPDPARTVIRPFAPGDPAGFVSKDHPRAQRIVDRVMTLDAERLRAELQRVEQSLDARHRDVKRRLRARFGELDGLTREADFSDDQKLLIGAYFSEEFSFESAALFNPSVVEHPDQAGVAPGDLRVLMSLRGIGEGHVSSLTFRTGVWSADGALHMDAPSPVASGPIVDMPTQSKRTAELDFDGADVSEAVVFPFLPSQGRGVEDVRLCRFQEEDGRFDYRGTFTAFDGSETRQAVLRTSDFRKLVLRGLDGDLWNSKGMAYFPRRIDGRFFMLGRQDNENVWVLSSDDEFTWSGGAKVVAPRYPWEFIQMGNCGSPIELDEGWLVLTHGVGEVRNYCMGACLLDKADPTKLLARLEQPLLEPSDKQRDGYVPNVVYSCGALLRGRTLLMPYGVADNFTAFATVDVDALLAAMA